MDKDPNNITLTDDDITTSPYDFIDKSRKGGIVVVSGSQRPQCYIWTFPAGKPRPKKESRLFVTGKYKDIFTKDLTRCRIVARTLRTNIEESYYQWDYIFEGNEVESYQNDGTVVLKLTTNPYASTAIPSNIFVVTTYDKPIQFILHPNTIFDEITNQSQLTNFDSQLSNNHSLIRTLQVIVDRTINNLNTATDSIALANQAIKQIQDSLVDIRTTVTDNKNELDARLDNIETQFINLQKRVDDHDLRVVALEKNVNNLNRFRHVVLTTNGDLTNISKTDSTVKTDRYPRSAFLL